MERLDEFVFEEEEGPSIASRRPLGFDRGREGGESLDDNNSEEEGDEPEGGDEEDEEEEEEEF